MRILSTFTLAAGSPPFSLSLQHRLELWPFSIPVWLVALVLLAAGVAVVYAARAQQRKGLASGRVVSVLAGLRLALLGLILVLALKPALAFVHTTTSAGTVWLLVDDSRSMQLTDPQATPVERLRWAAALGYLPSGGGGIRPGLPDLSLARIQMLRQTLPAAPFAIPGYALLPAPTVDQGGSNAEQAASIAVYIKQLEVWQTHAQQTRKALAADPALHDAAGTEIRRTVDTALAAFDESLSRARRADSLRSLAEGLRWNVVDTNLNLAGQDLMTLAQRYDEHVLADHGSDPALVQALARVTGLRRADLLQELLSPPAGGANSDAGAALAERLGRSQIKLLTFAEAAQVLPANDLNQLAEQLRQAMAPSAATAKYPGAIPVGGGTNLTAALQAVSQQESGHAAAAIFLTDGRHNAPGDPTEAARLLAARGLHVHSLLVGSEQVAPDAAADPPDAPEWIFKDDTARITARIHLDGLAGQKVTVELLRNGSILSQKSLVVRSNQEARALDFADKPGAPGVYAYQIRIPRVAQEANILNNQQTFHVRVKKDKLAVLLVEEQPRWEYQFLATSLARDPSLKLQTVLFAPAGILNVAPPPELARTRASPQNPRRDAGLLPDTLEQWQAFDVIILGDLPPEHLPVAKQQNLAAAVRDRGTTLVLIAGRNAMPQAYLSGEGPNAAPLSGLLPIEATPAWREAQLNGHLVGGFRPAISPAAGSGGGGGGGAGILGQLHSDPPMSAQLTG
ncbi:MAG: vWA domain-containing protein, partial [Phycisphaerae bacterium]